MTHKAYSIVGMLGSVSRSAPARDFLFYRSTSGPMRVLETEVDTVFALVASKYPAKNSSR
jgi:hypothetical protein